MNVTIGCVDVGVAVVVVDVGVELLLGDEVELLVFVEVVLVDDVVVEVEEELLLEELLDELLDELLEELLELEELLLDAVVAWMLVETSEILPATS